MNNKVALGQFYTVGNPFGLVPFLEWAEKISIKDQCILEPFAGSNNIIATLQSIGVCSAFKSYDLEPANPNVKYCDTIKNFPTNHKVCITNPPWLARNSATRKKINFPTDKYDDLYKLCLNLCLDNCDYVAALIPATYLQSGLFRDRLATYILLHNNLFVDTENPVCLALFDKEPTESTHIYYDNDFIGCIKDLEKVLPTPKTNKRIKFNDPHGALGFISFDDTKQPSIRFCEVQAITGYQIKHSSRFITRISGDFDDVTALIDCLNDVLADFRKNTHDLFLTPFKGVRLDGKYRRRMEYSMARKMINAI